MKKVIIIFILSAIAWYAQSQTLVAKTNKAVVDFSKSQNQVKSSVPKISWLEPLNQTTFQKEADFLMKIKFESKDPLKLITITAKEKGEDTPYATKTIQVKEDQKLEFMLEQKIMLAGSVNEVEVVVENIHGVMGVMKREIHVGETILADAHKLNRSDYALIIYTNEYDHWTKLTNPGFDARTIADQLKSNYGFQVDMLENPSQEQLWTKLKELAERKYQPLDQVFIFVAGHGHFDESFKEGYLVMKESIPNEAGNASYVSHNRLRNNVNSIPCEHIFLTMDVCFGGTFDQGIASARGAWNDPNLSQSEFIMRKLEYRTRKYLTSGGKEYVSDGVPGHHSPFAAKLIDALQSQGGNDGVLTLSELLAYTEKSNPGPRFGSFGDDAPGSEFVFVVK